MSKRFNKGSWFLTGPYLMACLAPAVVTGAMQVTWPSFEHNPISLYLLAVIFCAWYGGLGPGLLCVAVSFLLSDFFFVEPYSLFQFHKQGDLVRVVLFVIIGASISLLSELIHRERRRSKISLNALRASEDRYRKLADNFPNGAVITYDKDLRVTFIGGSDLQKAGVSPDFIVGKLLSEVAPPEVVTVVEPHFQTAFGGQTATYECSLPDSKTYLNAAAPLLDGNGLVNEILVISHDITERKRAEEAMSDLRRELELTMNSMEEGVHRVDINGDIVFENPAAARMLGWEASELVGKCSHLTMHHTRPDGTPYPKEECPTYATLRDGVSRRVADEVFWRQDGTSFPVEYSTAPMRNDRNEIVATVVTFRDITDRKQADDELIKQKEILQKIVEHIPVMINFNDEHGRLKLINREWQKTLGWSLEEVSSQHLDVFAECYPDPLYRQGVWDFITAATGEWMDFRTRTRNGATIDTSWARIKLSDGTTIGFGTDITARKQAEQALRQAEQKYRELFENAKEAYYVHDLSGRYTSINRAAEQLSGYSRDEVLGKHFSNFVAPEYAEGVRENLRRKLLEKGEATYEIEIVTKDGRRVPVEVSSRLIHEGEVAVGIQGTVYNTVERKRAEEALRGYSRQLIKAQEAERQRISRELHDQIGQVLTAIRINLETIRDSSNQAESNVLIDEGVAIVDQAIQQVRDLSFELRPSLLDNLGLVAALRWYSDQYTKRTGIRTRSVTNLRGSQTRLSQDLETACFRIVQEALTNVVRHANAKNVSINLSKLDHKIVLSIKDDGVGFDESANGAASATHLGLRGMKERALALGGTLKIESGAALGTEIRVSFPT